MGKITVIGLGAGDINQLTLGTYETIKAAEQLYVRTEQHPVVAQLREQGIKIVSYDSLYEQVAEFAEVYERIANELIEKACDGQTLLFAAPGHPLVAEQTTLLLLEKGAQRGIEVDIQGGQSFLDPLFSALRVDPSEGFTLLDALSLDKKLLNPWAHLIITQVYDDLTAADVKLTLMDVYPDDYEITFVSAAGVAGQEKVSKMPLYELDHQWQGVDNLAAVYVPPTAEDVILNRQFNALREIIAILRGPEGCPWDREQTHQSIRKHLIEEAYEVLETIDDDDPEAMCEELGDLLMQVMLHAQIAEDNGDFMIDDIIFELNEKLIRRHPHVFGAKRANTGEEAVVNWDQIKMREKEAKGIDLTRRSLLDGIPRGLPGLMVAYELSKRASKVGFDWDQVQDVYAKIEEELEEVKTAESWEHAKEEVGDLLFAAANLARFLKIDPEEALALTNRKFKQRFQYIENTLNKPLPEATLDEMEALWQEAKRK
ncbi:nucleoside triphosphate pyrophosphohydrolase [Ammoniphilus oxalaticus]|uniref:Nucleoside triphosphate pyrophosphohydrolase n=1 Tax=Ammoniphilus oxalaticus TaxID=66863 RepID=A0A419SG74_9BACL|nr:nucleoside triphosphate pyrophosphohydrolase [Ammoniphilus oxalaticus]RKD22792.1 nucleoside triphosphate pyrophosphohydrolase [Ammoniphilus oxalaticus]